MYKWHVFMTISLFLALGSCSESAEQAAATEETTEPTETESGSSASGTSSVPTAEETANLLTVPSGTELQVRLAHRVSSATNQSGDAFEAILDQDLVVDGQVVAPHGSTLTGQLTEVISSGKVKGRAKMTLALQTLQIGDTSYSIESDPITVEAEGTVKEDALKVGIGAGIGAVVGAIAGGKKGAAVGTAIGGGGGTAAVLPTKGDEIEFEVEQEFQFQLVRDLEVTMR